MPLESDDGSDGVECENKNDLEDEDQMEVHSEDQDTEQDFSSEDSEDQLDMNEEVFLESMKNQNGGKIQ